MGQLTNDFIEIKCRNNFISKNIWVECLAFELM